MHDIRFRVPRPDFAPLWFAWRHHPANLDPGWQSPLPLETMRQRLAVIGGDFSMVGKTEAAEFRWIVEFGNEAIGTVSLRPQTSGAKLAGEIGFMLNPAIQGRGLGSLTVEAFVAALFAQTPIERILAAIRGDNFRSIRTVDKLGFQRGTSTTDVESGDVLTDYWLTRAAWESKLKATP